MSKIKESHYNKKLFLEFKRLIQRKGFYEAATNFRQELNIPPGGFKNSSDYIFKWYLKDGNLIKSAKQRKKLQNVLKNLKEKFTLPFYLMPLVEAFVIMGDLYKEFQFFNITAFDFGCKLELGKDGASIKIHPVAKQRDISGFVKKNWKFISQYFSFWQPNPFAKQVRLRKNEERDDRIFVYYQRGLLNYMGGSNHEEVHKINPEAYVMSDIDPSLKGLDMDAIRKIIQIQKKLRK